MDICAPSVSKISDISSGHNSGGGRFQLYGQKLKDEYGKSDSK